MYLYNIFYIFHLHCVRYMQPDIKSTNYSSACIDDYLNIFRIIHNMTYDLNIYLSLFPCTHATR